MEMILRCVSKPNIVLLVLLGACSSGAAVNADFTLEQRDFSTTAIVIPKESDSIKRFAALELQKHLRLITGHDFTITNEIGEASKSFMVGIKPESDQEPLGDEEARYLVTEKLVYLYGDDQIRRRRGSDQNNALDSKRNRAGTLFAVYNFLENELGIHWIEPGDHQCDRGTGLTPAVRPSPLPCGAGGLWVPVRRMCSCGRRWLW